MTTKTKQDTTPAAPKVEVIPAGSREVLWVLAAAWAGVTVQELLADTAPVKAAHYEAASRVEHALDEWDTAQLVPAEFLAGEKRTDIIGDLRAVAARMAEAASLLTHDHDSAAEWASLSHDVYRVSRDTSTLLPVKGL